MARWARGRKETVNSAREGEKTGCGSEFLIFLLVLSFALECLSLNKDADTDSKAGTRHGGRQNDAEQSA